MNIEDPSNGNSARVSNDRRLGVFSTTEGQFLEASRKGNAFNLNTGIIALTDGTAESAIMYIENQEDTVNGVSDLILQSIAIGVGVPANASTESCEITLVRNPTGGTIVSGASNADIISNSNFGATNVLSTSSKVYKGAQGNTLTGGSDHGIFFMGSSSRLFATIEIVIPKGASIGITITPNNTGAVNVYAALIVHRRNGDLG